MIIKKYIFLLLLPFALCMCSCGNGVDQNQKPNILWVIIEDASCHISCYGETAIETPNMDQLASEGILFEKAFVTAPVCSPARSALVTGMYQNSIGSHNHRSQVNKGKGGGNSNYYESFRLPEEISIASKLFAKAGYYTTNETIEGAIGKQDYNFIDADTYNGTTWKDTPEGRPFFTQIQLHGGKNRSRRADTEDFTLPPYYVEDSIMRNDWKDYLGSWLDTDDEVGKIVSDLKTAGVYENTLIFVITDHGVSHLRGKQYLYDEGIRIPMIVKLPEAKNEGTTRTDMVSHIDMLPTSLAFAGLSIPENMQGKDMFDDNYEHQNYIFSFRDRCDETVEIMRSVRSKKFKYIRNFMSFRPHAQRNQYKDSKEIGIHMRELFNNGALNELQASMYLPKRPTEEFYDLENDPFEINNLAGDPKYKTELEHLKTALYEKMEEVNDPGLIPEPILEDMGKEYGNKYTAMKQPEFADIQQRLIQVIEAGERADIDYLMEKTDSENAAERYWAIAWLGVNKEAKAGEKIRQLLKDEVPAVRIAAHFASYKIDANINPIPGLAKELNNDNLIEGMYAMTAVEQSGIRNEEVKELALKAKESKYEFTKRYGKYLNQVCSENNE